MPSYQGKSGAVRICCSPLLSVTSGTDLAGWQRRSYTLAATGDRLGVRTCWGAVPQPARRWALECNSAARIWHVAEESCHGGDPSQAAPIGPWSELIWQLAATTTEGEPSPSIGAALAPTTAPSRTLACLFVGPWRQEPQSVLDPSYGGCAVLRVALDEMRQMNTPEPSERVYGADIDDAAGGEVGGAPRLSRCPAKNLVSGDFLALAPGAELPLVGAVVGNPPYVRHHRITAPAKAAAEAAATAAGVRLSGRASLGLFRRPRGEIRRTGRANGAPAAERRDGSRLRPRRHASSCSAVSMTSCTFGCGNGSSGCAGDSRPLRQWGETPR